MLSFFGPIIRLPPMNWLSNSTVALATSASRSDSHEHTMTRARRGSPDPAATRTEGLPATRTAQRQLGRPAVTVVARSETGHSATQAWLGQSPALNLPPEGPQRRLAPCRC